VVFCGFPWSVCCYQDKMLYMCSWCHIPHTSHEAQIDALSDSNPPIGDMLSCWFSSWGSLVGKIGCCYHLRNYSPSLFQHVSLLLLVTLLSGWKNGFTRRCLHSAESLQAQGTTWKREESVTGLECMASSWHNCSHPESWPSWLTQSSLQFPS
jgi:hypothetical protein